MKNIFFLIIAFIISFSSNVYSDDTIQHWKKIFDPKIIFDSSQYYQFIISDVYSSDSLNYIVFGAAGNCYYKIIKTTDGGTNWKLILDSKWDPKIINVYADVILSPDSILLPSDNWGHLYIFRTTNGGLIWDTIDSKLNCTLYNYDKYNPDIISFTKNGIGIAYVFDNIDSVKKIIKTSDFGLSWHYLSNFPNFDELCFIDLHSENDISCWAYNDTAQNNFWFCRSRDGGKTWLKIPMPPGYPLISKSLDSLTIWAAVTDSSKLFRKIIKTSDGGSTWLCINQSPARWRIPDMDILDSNHIVFFQSYGTLIYSSDAGINWTIDSTLKLLVNQAIYMEQGKYISSDRILLGIEGSGCGEVYLYDINGFPTEVQEEIIENTQFLISPNPAYNNINIKTNIDVPCQLSLQILNSFGQSILPSITEFANNGLYSKHIDLSAIAPGLYFVIVRAGKERFVQKFVKVE